MYDGHEFCISMCKGVVIVANTSENWILFIMSIKFIENNRVMKSLHHGIVSNMAMGKGESK